MQLMWKFVNQLILLLLKTLMLSKPYSIFEIISKNPFRSLMLLMLLQYPSVLYPQNLTKQLAEQFMKRLNEHVLNMFVRYWLKQICLFIKLQRNSNLPASSIFHDTSATKKE